MVLGEAICRFLDGSGLVSVPEIGSIRGFRTAPRDLQAHISHVRLPHTGAALEIGRRVTPGSPPEDAFRLEGRVRW